MPSIRSIAEGGVILKGFHPLLSASIGLFFLIKAGSFFLRPRLALRSLIKAEAILPLNCFYLCANFNLSTFLRKVG